MSRQRTILAPRLTHSRPPHITVLRPLADTVRNGSQNMWLATSMAPPSAVDSLWFEDVLYVRAQPCILATSRLLPTIS
jgi:hypothetical protein